MWNVLAITETFVSLKRSQFCQKNKDSSSQSYSYQMKHSILTLPQRFPLCVDTFTFSINYQSPCAILELYRYNSGIVMQSENCTLRRTVPELYRFLLCVEHINASCIFIMFLIHCCTINLLSVYVKGNTIECYNNLCPSPLFECSKIC